MVYENAEVSANGSLKVLIKKRFFSSNRFHLANPSQLPMPALTLRTYQQQALDSLQHFLHGATRTGSLALAWAQDMQRQAQTR